MSIASHIILTAILVTAPVGAMSEQQRLHHEHEHEHEHEMSMAQDPSAAGDVTPLTHTPEIDAAIAAGGNPLVADVLGVVCDFCATAMNKIFGGRKEVAAVYVDLDTKALNLVLKPGAILDNETIGDLATQAGYRIAQVHRNVGVVGES